MSVRGEVGDHYQNSFFVLLTQLVREILHFSRKIQGISKTLGCDSLSSLFLSLAVTHDSQPGSTWVFLLLSRCVRSPGQ